MKSSAVVLAVTLFACMDVAKAAELDANEPCPIGTTSNAERFGCLYRQYQALDDGLRKDIAAMVAHLPTAKLWQFDKSTPALTRRFLERRAAGLIAADVQWRYFVETECREVDAAVFEGGSGQDTYEFECRIARFKSRRQELRTREPYKSMMPGA